MSYMYVFNQYHYSLMKNTLEVHTFYHKCVSSVTHHHGVWWWLDWLEGADCGRWQRYVVRDKASIPIKLWQSVLFHFRNYYRSPTPTVWFEGKQSRVCEALFVLLLGSVDNKGRKKLMYEDVCNRFISFWINIKHTLMVHSLHVLTSCDRDKDLPCEGIYLSKQWLTHKEEGKVLSILVCTVCVCVCR